MPALVREGSFAFKFRFKFDDVLTDPRCTKTDVTTVRLKQSISRNKSDDLSSVTAFESSQACNRMILRVPANAKNE